MDYEKKYKEALKRARVWKEKSGMPKNKQGILDDIFPELNESEDERIRKAIMCGMNALKDQKKETFAAIPIDDCIAWLEKQGEQKTVDKVEPKFKVGDWIVSNEKLYVYQIEEINEFVVKVREINGETFVVNVNCLKDAHLWSIKDAKNGDVLAASDGSIFLFAGVVDCACKYYVALSTDNYVKINKEAKGGYWETSRAVYPATKEQRDMLFQKMKEAGYEWDADKKELKKIDPCSDCINNKDCINCENGSLKETQKSTWSEEDEVKINRIVACLENLNVADNDILLKDINWIKSLKQRIGE